MKNIEFKPGMRVWQYDFGWGTVQNTLPYVAVLTDNKNKEILFYKNGVPMDRDSYRLLLTEEEATRLNIKPVFKPLEIVLQYAEYDNGNGGKHQILIPGTSEELVKAKKYLKHYQAYKATIRAEVNDD